MVGHVTALALGARPRGRGLARPELAARSQYWMLALMVGFTWLGLYLLSQANAWRLFRCGRLFSLMPTGSIWE